MLLCLSSGLRAGVLGGLQSVCWWEVLVDLAGDVALEAADDLAFGQALGGAAFDVGAGGLVVAHPDDGDDVEGAVGGSVAAAAEPVPAGGAAAAGWLWGDAAQLGEGCFAVDAVGVVAGGDEELAGDLDPDAGSSRSSGAACFTSASICLLRVLISLSSAFQRRARSRSAVLVPAISIRSGSATSDSRSLGFGAKPQATVDQCPLGQHDQLVAQR